MTTLKQAQIEKARAECRARFRGSMPPKRIKQVCDKMIGAKKEFDTADFEPSAPEDLVPTGILPKLPGGTPIWAMGLIGLAAVGVGVGIFASRRAN